jgi:hypothetical protein
MYRPYTLLHDAANALEVTADRIGDNELEAGSEAAYDWLTLTAPERLTPGLAKIFRTVARNIGFAPDEEQMTDTERAVYALAKAIVLTD